MAACATNSILPKKMYQLEEMVGASVSLLLTNSAPLLPYLRVVPPARAKLESEPFVKSIETVFPSALSAGQAAAGVSKMQNYSSWAPEGRNVLFFVGSQSVEVWAVTIWTEAKAIRAERAEKRMMADYVVRIEYSGMKGRKRSPVDWKSFML